MPKLVKISMLMLAASVCSRLPLQAATSKAEPDKVRISLTNGDTLTGTIVEEDKQGVVLRSPVLGEITIPRSSIAKNPGDTQAAPPAVASPAKPAVATTAPKKPAPPLPALHGVKPASKPWRTKLEFGFIMEDALNDTTRYTVSALTQKTLGRHQFRLSGRLSYANQDKQSTADRAEAGFRWRQNFDNRAFTQTQTTYYRDRISGIDANVDQNAGVGYGLFDTPRFDFNFGVGLTGQYRDAENIEEHTGALAEFFQDQTLKLNERTKIVQSLNVQYWPDSPLVSTGARDAENLKCRFSTALIGKLSESITLNLRYEYDYDNAVANPEARANQRITSSLGYLF